MSYLRRFVPLVTLAVAVASLYLYKLNGVGVLEPDEPRYLAIGRSMSISGDLITPRLWGNPWFEKPPLLYWVTALGTRLGLGPELAGRLPVALLSLSFLALMWWLLRREFGPEAASVSTLLLATSAGWLSYSSLALTDLPLAAFFSLAVLLCLPLLRSPGDTRYVARRFFLVGLCLGAATLAKGLVPLALAVPFAWFLRKYWRSWWLAILSCLLVALPWYAAVTLRNGRSFLEEFFWKHHIERIYSISLQHVQPWYFYVPVILAAIFPWTPLLGLLVTGRNAFDTRQRFLACCFAWGFVLFSVPVNKLPGYLLPLLPLLFVLLGSCFASRPLRTVALPWLLACAVFIGLLPLVAHILPETLEAGKLSLAGIGPLTRTDLFYVAAPVAAVLLARRSWIGMILILCVVAGGFFVKITAYPKLDQLVSARGLWHGIQQKSPNICDGGINRDWAYGLAFYRGSPFPPCSSGHFAFILQQPGHAPPVVSANAKLGR